MKAEYLDRPIAFQRAFVCLGVGITGALMLSQAVYWSKRTKDSEGWFYKSQEEWQEETGMGRREQETARKRLIAGGFLKEHKKGIPCRLFYRVDYSAIDSALGVQTSMAESAKLECRKAPSKEGGNSHAITENTQENTSESAISRKRSKQSCLTVFLDDCQKAGEKAIPAQDPVFDYSAKAGIHEEWLRACWLEFSEDYKSKPDKKYSDWRAHFRTAVRRNWYQLWWVNPSGVCELTSKGRQAMAAYGETA